MQFARTTCVHASSALESSAAAHAAEGNRSGCRPMRTVRRGARLCRLRARTLSLPPVAPFVSVERSEASETQL